MDWAFSVNGLGLNLWNFWKEKLSFGFWKNQQPKAVKKSGKIG